MKLTIFIIFIVLPILVYFGRRIWFRLGQSPEPLQFDGALRFDSSLRKFQNVDEDIVQKAHKEADTFAIMRGFLFPKNTVTPPASLPEVRVDLEQFLEDSKDATFVWLGHSSFLIRIAGKTLLIDPVFSNHAAPLPLMTPRFQPPVMPLEELPDIDAIVISHDHYDHLDCDTIKFFLDKKAKFFTPLGVGSHLRYWGIAQERITELDWWQSASLDNLTLTCAPSQHFSGRSLPFENKTLWASWAITSDQTNIFYSGDSGYSDHFQEIGERLGPFEISFLENGQYNDQWRPVHMHPEESAQAYFDLKSESMVAVHWGMFNMSLHNWYDPIETITMHAQNRGINLITPKIGEVFDADYKQNESWWRKLMP